MWRKASPTALAPPAQAATGQMHMPCSPKRMAIWPAARLVITMGMKKGETRSKPRLCPVSQEVWRVPMPPMPLDRATPIRALSSRSRSRPLWAMASAAAVTANWAKRSIRRISFFASTPEGSNSFTSPARDTVWAEWS